MEGERVVLEVAVSLLEPIDDEDVSVTATMNRSQLDELEAMFPDAPSDPEWVRRAV